MTNVDEAFEFITKVFVQVTARDMYLICREYNIFEDEDVDKLKDELSKAGWQVSETGEMYL